MIDFHWQNVGRNMKAQIESKQMSETIDPRRTSKNNKIGSCDVCESWISKSNTTHYVTETYRKRQ